MHFPQIQIQQQYGKIGITTNNASQEMMQPRATYDVTTTRPQVDIVSPRGQLTIDQSRAFDAVAHGSVLTVLSRIYEQAKQVALQGEADIVRNGNRLADIKNHSNAIAEIAGAESQKESQIQIAGEASFLNVDIRYVAQQPQFNYQPGKINIFTHPNMPQVAYHRGNVDVYMLQWPKVVITPPQIDQKV